MGLTLVIHKIKIRNRFIIKCAVCVLNWAGIQKEPSSWKALFVVNGLMLFNQIYLLDYGFIAFDNLN